MHIFVASHSVNLRVHQHNPAAWKISNTIFTNNVENDLGIDLGENQKQYHELKTIFKNPGRLDCKPGNKPERF